MQNAKEGNLNCSFDHRLPQPKAKLVHLREINRDHVHLHIHHQNAYIIKISTHTHTHIYAHQLIGQNIQTSDV